ncbi:MAG TPA: GAP family protein [Candidatus Binatia bacterium]|nr:GAP family protein [Candidatus Binatia bacterium]
MVATVSLPILVGAALVDSINPCAFGVLIFLLAYLSKAFRQPRKLLIHGGVYIFGVYVTYLAAGLLLLPTIQHLGRFSVIAYIIIASLIIIAGLLEIKDYFFYGKWFSLQIAPDDAQRIKMYVKRISDNIFTAFGLGIFVALVELPCTGAVYLAVLTIMSLTGVTAHNVLQLLLYNVIFVLPLALIVWAMYKGVTEKHMHAWREKHKGAMRLMTGIVLVGMGIWMLWYISG